MKNDPIDVVRQARSDISREFGNDPERLIAHYVEMQANFKGQLIPGPDAADDLDEAPATPDESMSLTHMEISASGRR